MNKLKYFLLLSTVVVTFSSCKKVLEKDPFDKINAENFFKTEKDLELYSNGFIEKNIPANDAITFGDNFADNVATTASTTFLAGAFTADDQTGWSISVWQRLRNINYFLENLPKAQVSDQVKKHYEGVGRFWRAWFYFDMVKTFGDVPYYDKTIDPTNPELYKGRDKREVVMKNILDDLTFASTNCTATKSPTSSTITKWVALGVKSRVALFEGTYRKYHTELSLQNTATDLLNQAASAAKELMDAQQYSLVNSAANVQTQYRDLFISESPKTQEVILSNIFNDALSRWHNTTWVYNSASFGVRTSLTKQFINTYLNLDGSRFTDQTNYDKIGFVDEVKNRDYRLKQTVKTPGFTRTIAGVAGKPSAPNLGVTLTGYQIIKWSLDNDKHDGSANSYNSISILRYAEILLNYAEAKAELGQMDETVWNQTIKLLRERAGVNGKSPVDYDPYLASYYLNQTTDKWILEVRRERGIELTQEDFRYDDIMRWKLGEMLTKPWYGLYIPQLDTPMDLNSDGVNDLVVTNNAAYPNGTYYKIVLGTSSFRLNSNNNLEYVVNRTWADKKYLRPIPKSAQVENPALGQNTGWGN
jgi:hypothetical protein